MSKSCPVNFKMLDENQIRIQALLITLTALVFLVTGWRAFVFLLVYDFAARLFVSPKISPFVQIALVTLKIFKIKKQSVDSAPKIFASYIGLGFSVAIVCASLLGADEAATLFAIILTLCAAMEAFFNYCVGCKFYAMLHYFNIV